MDLVLFTFCLPFGISPQHTTNDRQYDKQQTGCRHRPECYLQRLFRLPPVLETKEIGQRKDRRVESKSNEKYLRNRWISGNQSSDNGRKVHRPKSALGLTIVYQYRTVESSVDVQIAELTLPRHVKVKPDYLRWSRITANKVKIRPSLRI